jgi:hypothetical protein
MTDDSVGAAQALLFRGPARTLTQDDLAFAEKPRPCCQHCRVPVRPDLLDEHQDGCPYKRSGPVE